VRRTFEVRRTLFKGSFGLMPTPFMHLQLVERLRQRLSLSVAGELATLSRLLAVEWGAFYLGSVAPDFQAICHVPREATHFYPIPPAPGDEGAFGRLLAQYPQFTAVDKLPPAQAVFMAGYGAHLLYDLLWDGAILTPLFRLGAWDEVRERFMGYNSLLTYLDKKSWEGLPPTAVDTLHQWVMPEGMLPFATAVQMWNWQTLLVEQLQPGASLRTIEIYAGRMGVSESQFAAQLADEAWMGQKVFQHLPPDLVAVTMDTAVDKSITLLQTYLAPLLA
jgi:hypothetical protein